MKNQLGWMAVLEVALLLAGCNGNGSDPLGISPLDSAGSLKSMSLPTPSQTHLWGYYDVYIDIPAQTAEAVVSRGTMFTANVVNFVNGKPASLSFKINSTPIGTDWVDVDIDVSITHPFPGLTQYNGYDVRGVFMGDGSGIFQYGSALTYPVLGTDQFMLADPVDGFGGPDGYTRWYNLSEFSGGGMPLFQYTPGKLATSGFAGTSKINPYKYFADSLQAEDDLWTWLADSASQYGVFSSGSKNTRNYYLRFPDTKGVQYGYAILADWKGVDPGDHPSNAAEAIASLVDDQSNVYFIDDITKGGNLALDLSLYNWHGQPSSIYVESTVLTAIHQLSPGEMTPVGGGENYSTWHIEIPADNILGVDGNEYWLIAVYSDSNYGNDFGTPNLAQDDPLAAFFRFDLDVSSNPTNQNPICDLAVVTALPAHGWDGGVPVEFDASGSTDPDGDTLSFEWDFDGDGVYGEDPDDSFVGTPSNPIHYYTADFSDQVCVRVTDGKGGSSVCCQDVDVIAHPSKNINLRPGVQANDFALDHTNGDLIVLFNDKTVWRYTHDSWYQSGTQLFALWSPTIGAWAIDISPNQYIIIEGDYASNNPLTLIYDLSGTMLTAISQGGPGYPNVDAAAMTSGTYENDLVYIAGWPSPVGTFALRCPDGTWFPPEWYYNWTPVYTGVDQIYYGYIKGVESDMNGDYLWYLEGDPEFYAARWVLSTSGWPYDQKYDNAYFGTGVQTDSDDGWYACKDISRDDKNRYFVLDQLSSGDPRVKVWTVDGNTTTSIGGFGDSTSISALPRRIQGGDFNGDIVVLHGPDGGTCMVSVFVPIEMPE